MGLSTIALAAREQGLDMYNAAASSSMAAYQATNLIHREMIAGDTTAVNEMHVFAQLKKHFVVFLEQF